MSDALITPRGVAAFLNIWTPQTTMNGQPLPPENHRFSITGIFTEEDMRPIKDSARPIVAEAFPKGAPPNIALPWVSCTAKNQQRIAVGKEPFAGYEDGKFAVAFNRNVNDGRVGVVDHNLKSIAAADNLLYAGCIVIIRYQAYVTTKHVATGRLCFQLEHLQVVGEGTPLQPRSVPVEHAFEPTEYEGEYAGSSSGEFDPDSPF